MVTTTIEMTVEDVGDDISVGTEGVVFTEPSDAEELVGVSINNSMQYLPQSVFE